MMSSRDITRRWVEFGEGAWVQYVAILFFSMVVLLLAYGFCRPESRLPIQELSAVETGSVLAGGTVRPDPPVPPTPTRPRPSPEEGTVEV